VDIFPLRSICFNTSSITTVNNVTDSDFYTEIFGELVIYLNLCYCVSKS
jgi:hypothetical protein